MLALMTALAASTTLATVTKTIKPPGQGGDYDNFQSAWNSIPGSLTDHYVFEVYTGTYATFDATGKTTGSWTITFKAATGQSPRIYSATGGDYGVYSSGQNNVKLAGLEIDCYSPPVYLASSCDGWRVEGCRLYGGSYSGYTVYIYSGCDSDSVIGCRVDPRGSGYGIYFYNSSYSYYCYFANNFICNWTNYGIYSYYHYYTKFYYNTICGSSSYALYCRYGYSWEMKDNILQGTSYALYLYYGNNWPTSNYNCYYVPSSATVIYRGGSTYTLATWRTYSGQDMQSVNVDPLVVSANDLHLRSTSTLKTAGTPVTGITKDIDGDTRHLTTPSIGADEFVPGAALSGTKYIKSGVNKPAQDTFPSFNAALTAMLVYGVGGDLTFNVCAGTYNENLVISNPGNGSYRVTFQANETFDAIDSVYLTAATSYAVQLTDASRFRFRNLKVAGYTSYGFYLGYSSTGSDRNLIEGCRIAGPNGVYIDQACDDDTIFGCKIQATSSYGINLPSTGYRYRTVIADNMVSGWTSCGIYAYYHYDTELYYNTIYSTSGSYAFYDYYGTLSGTGKKYKNNIYYSPNYCYYTYYGTQPPTESNYNCFWRVGSSSIIYDQGTARDLASWQTNRLRDQQSINQNPLVLNSTNLHLRTGSPCIGAGTALTWPTVDIDGDSRGSTVDMGADEWTFPGDPLSGVYTVKQDGSGDFRSFTEARDAILMRGIVGDVIFDVYAGTYAEQVLIEGVTDGSRRVTFRAHQTADGYDNVVLSSGMNYGIWLRDQSNYAFENVTVQNFTSYGVYLQHIDAYTGCDNVTIRGCKINGPNGIYLHYGADSDTIIGCDIRATSSYGIYQYGYSSWPSLNNVIANNMLSGFTSNGIRLYYHGGTKLCYNTVANFANGLSWLVYDEYGVNTQSQNNIFYQYSSSYYCYYKYYGNLLSSDYNCFFNNGTGNIAYYEGTYYTWATWRSSRGMDPHGINRNPLFVSGSVPYNLHIQETSPCRDSAMVLAGFTTDIDGQGRGAKPDIGADEVFADYSVSQVNRPTGLIQMGVPVTPQVHIKHLAGPAATLDLTVKVFKGATEVHSETKAGVTLGVGEEKDVDFNNAWTPAAPGADYTVSCWHSASPDGVPANDTARAAVEVGTVDVALVEVTWPTAVTNLNTTDFPRVKLHNNGPFAATVSVSMAIDDAPPADGLARGDAVSDGVVWSQTRGITVPAGEDRTLTYSLSWTAAPLGDYYARAYHWLAYDQDRSNDTTELYFDVVSPTKVDIGVARIDQPPSYVDTGSTITGSATLKNYSANSTSFTAWFFIEDPAGTRVESWSVPLSLNAGEEHTEVFGTHAVGTTEGAWAAVCSTWAVNDTFADNDRLEKGFTVSAAPPFEQGWREVANVPSSPTPKQVKDGGWLAAATPAEDGGTYIYAAKGNKTGDFFRYDPVDGDSGTWRVLDSIPADEGGRAKLPKKGCAAASDGEAFIYMTKGNNTLGFWKYDIVNDSWTRMPDVPLGPGNKKVKGGNDLAYARGEGDTGWVYLMKGYKTEFYRFNVQSSRWDTLADVPYGVAPKYNAGSFLAYDGGQYLYAHQSKYTDALKTHHFMFRYDLTSQLWAESLSGMPVQGRDGGKMKNKKSKDGGSGVFGGGFLYALKGGNTCQFYRYEPVPGDSWTELDTIRSFGSTARKKKVKAGGDLAVYSPGILFAMKGNKTYEFWRYVEPAYSLQPIANSRSGVQANPSTIYDVRFSIFPNPITSSFATIRYAMPKAGPMSINVFDVAGRSVFRQSSIGNRSSTMSLDLRTLANGVYLVRFDAEGYTHSRKLVVQR